jgi:hypothetical protein
MLVRVSTIALLLLLTACGAGGGNREAPRSPRGTSGLSGSPFATPKVRVPAGSQTITGRLGADSIEGGCAYLQTEAGKRYEVIYPKGWKLDKGSARLTNPQGEIVARAGDTVTVRGEIATDMASICQIGPIFRATEVVTSGR